MEKYPIEIEGYNSMGINEVAKKLKITHMRCTAFYEGESPDDSIRFFALPHPSGWEINVADTNADPIWEEGNESDWAELLEECGVEI